MLDQNIRKASESEIFFYENSLYPLQDEIFKLIQSEKFYLSGGTCLSRFYYQHRYSEDLDFFFDGFRYSKAEFEITFREIMNRLSEKYQTEITMQGEYFKRGFVYQGAIALKIEFIYENYKNVGVRKQVQGIRIDTKENIATNILTAIYDRKSLKDYIDLFFLLQELDFDQIAEWAQSKIVPLDYEGVLITFADPKLEGTVLLKKTISEEEFNNFIKNLIRKMVAHAKRQR